MQHAQAQPDAGPAAGKGLIKDKAAAVSLGVTGLAYNSRLFKEKGWATPTSWNDLADPRFKDKVVFQSMASSTFGLHGFLMYNRLHGGSDTDVNPGFTAWKKNVGPNVLEYIPNSAKLSEWCKPMRPRCSRSPLPR